MFEVLRKENEQRRMEIWEDYESNYAGLERYELELADEYETLFLPAYAVSGSIVCRKLEWEPDTFFFTEGDSRFIQHGFKQSL